jgi:hypothetical protein
LLLGGLAVADEPGLLVGSVQVVVSPLWLCPLFFLAIDETHCPWFLKPLGVAVLAANETTQPWFTGWLASALLLGSVASVASAVSVASGASLVFALSLASGLFDPGANAGRAGPAAKAAVAESARIANAIRAGRKRCIDIASLVFALFASAMRTTDGVTLSRISTGRDKRLPVQPLEGLPR